MGGLLIFTLFTKFVNRCLKRQFENPIINSPFSDWEKMTKTEKGTAIFLAFLSFFVVSIFVSSEIVYLLQGNSELRQILSLSTVFFAIIAPLQIMWLNQDLRHLMIKGFCCQKKINSVHESRTDVKIAKNGKNFIAKPANKVSLNANNSSKDTQSEFSFCTAF